MIIHVAEPKEENGWRLAEALRRAKIGSTTSHRPQSGGKMEVTVSIHLTCDQETLDMLLKRHNLKIEKIENQP